jgi:hypothetical protein
VGTYTIGGSSSMDGKIIIKEITSEEFINVEVFNLLGGLSLLLFGDNCKWNWG